MNAHNPFEPPASVPSDGNRQPGDVDPSNDDWQRQGKLIVLATFDNAPEAHCLRSELEQNGIRATVANETSAQTVGASLFGRIAAVWIEVLVLERDADKALAIKNDFLAKNTTPDIEEWQCQCGETVDAGFAQCWSCMAPHPDAKLE